MTRKGIHNPIIADNIARGMRLSEDGEIILPSGKIHRTYGGKSRYLRVTLYSNGKKISVNKARILCWLHHGPPPTDEHEADHIDLNSRNDDPSNLRWATRSENTANISPEATAARKKWMRDRHADNKRKIAAHDDLVAALTVAREDLGELVQCRHSSDTCNCNEHCRLRDMDAALAKAGA